MERAPNGGIRQKSGGMLPELQGEDGWFRDLIYVVGARSSNSLRLQSQASNGWQVLKVWLRAWWVWLDSNQRPRDYESPALTD